MGPVQLDSRVLFHFRSCSHLILRMSGYALFIRSRAYPIAAIKANPSRGGGAKPMGLPRGEEAGLPNRAARTTYDAAPPPLESKGESERGLPPPCPRQSVASRISAITQCGGGDPGRMAQAVLFVVFVVELVASLVVLMTWESGSGVCSFEERNTARGCRMLRRAPHRKRRRRQRRGCRLEGHLPDG